MKHWSDELLHNVKDFLIDRKHRVVLNGQCFSWIDVQTGVPQRNSILDPYSFVFILMIYRII